MIETIAKTEDGWVLQRRGNELELVKEVPYDGTIRFTTEERPVDLPTPGKCSQYGLTRQEVTDRLREEVF